MVNVRPAEPRDDAAIAALFATYAEEYAYNLGDQDVVGEGQQARAYYADGGMLVAENDEEVVGCVAFEPWGEGRCRMKRMIVAPSGRGQGVGRKLGEVVLIAARDAGFQLMCLDTTTPMKAAAALYKSLGFEEYVPDYEAPCNEVFYMRKALN